MRRSLLLGTLMVLALMLAIGLMGVPGAYAQPQAAPVAQATPTTDDDDDAETAPTPGSLPDTGAGGGANIALLGVLGALALGVAGAALLTTGRKSESES